MSGLEKPKQMCSDYQQMELFLFKKEEEEKRRKRQRKKHPDERAWEEGELHAAPLPAHGRQVHAGPPAA